MAGSVLSRHKTSPGWSDIFRSARADKFNAVIAMRSCEPWQQAAFAAAAVERLLLLLFPVERINKMPFRITGAFKSDGP